MDWLTRYNGIIRCTMKTVQLTHIDGTKVELQATTESSVDGRLNQANAMEDSRVEILDNVVTDALSRKSQVNAITLQEMRNDICKKFEKLNLGMLCNSELSGGIHVILFTRAVGLRHPLLTTVQYGQVGHIVSIESRFFDRLLRSWLCARKKPPPRHGRIHPDPSPRSPCSSPPRRTVLWLHCRLAGALRPLLASPGLSPLLLYLQEPAPNPHLKSNPQLNTLDLHSILNRIRARYLWRLAEHPAIGPSDELRVFLQAEGKMPLSGSTDVASRMLDGPARLPRQLPSGEEDVVQPAKGGRDLLRIFKELKQSVVIDWVDVKPPLVEEERGVPGEEGEAAGVGAATHQHITTGCLMLASSCPLHKGTNRNTCQGSARYG
ncbi:uncharacterized protein LOC133905977 [Phragmites australis]|uniref:uncharacterized protein LOC133905977 n=1 Tax=Phragmites australis TaxID=29695 RepID=UPI002D781B1A|nr:uncharacterized protein LOC133905977 [Phragmites australis]